jgi:ankyrin repeat protein
MPANIFRSSGTSVLPVAVTLFVVSLLLSTLVLLSGCNPKPAPPATNSAPAAVNNAPPSRSADEIALLDASIKGDTAAVKSLLDKGVSPNTKDNDGRTPLTEAAYRGYTEIAKMLIDHGADLFAKKRDGETPITMAAGHPDIAQLMKRDLELADVARKGDEKAVKEMLDKGAYVNVRDPEGRTPLTEAAWEGHVEVVKLLLERGADANARKNDGTTPLSIATGRGHKEIAELLKKAGAK